MAYKVLLEIAQLQKTKKPIKAVVKITPKDTSKSLLEEAFSDEPVKELLEDALEVDTRPYYYKPRARFTDIMVQCTKCKLSCTLLAKRNGNNNTIVLELEHAFYHNKSTIMHKCGGRCVLYAHLPSNVILI